MIDPVTIRLIELLIEPLGIETAESQLRLRYDIYLLIEPLGIETQILDFQMMDISYF